MLSENYAEIFKTRMHEILKLKNMTEDELYRQAGYTDEQIELFRNDDFGDLDYDIVARIPYVLNISMDYLMGVIDSYDETPLEKLNRQLHYSLLVADDNQDPGKVITETFKKTLEEIENANYPDDVMSDFLCQLEEICESVKSNLEAENKE